MEVHAMIVPFEINGGTSTILLYTSFFLALVSNVAVSIPNTTMV